MKKTLKSFGIKSLAALLSVLMILTALPLSAFAIGLESSDYSSVDHSFDRLSEAFEVVELTQLLDREFLVLLQPKPIQSDKQQGIFMILPRDTY